MIAIFTALGSLIVYNLEIKALYDSEAYRNPFRGMEFIPVKGIDQLTINSASSLSVKVQYGKKEGIWVLKHMKEDVKTAVQGSHLTLGLADHQDEDINEAKRKNHSYTSGGIVLVTQQLRSIVTKEGGSKGVIGEVDVRNYKLDHLDLNLSSNMAAEFHNMTIRNFNATIGQKNRRGGELRLYPFGKIDTAHFNVPGEGTLILNGAEIGKVTYDVSDKARVMLSGKELEVIKK